MAQPAEALERFPTVADFLSDLVDSVKDNEAIKRIGEHMPAWIGATADAAGTWAAPLKLVGKLVEKTTKKHSPEEVGLIACTAAYQAAAAETIRTVGPPRDAPDFGRKIPILEEIHRFKATQSGMMRTFSFERPYAHPFYWKASAQLETAIRYFACQGRFENRPKGGAKLDQLFS